MDMKLNNLLSNNCKIFYSLAPLKPTKKFILNMFDLCRRHFFIPCDPLYTKIIYEYMKDKTHVFHEF